MINVKVFRFAHRGVEQLAAREAHNLEVGGSNPPPATKKFILNRDRFSPLSGALKFSARIKLQVFVEM